MKEKQIVTPAEIKKDISDALKQPQAMSKSGYDTMTVISLIIACLLVVIEFFYPMGILWLWIVSALLVCLILGFLGFRRKRLMNRITFEDYEITTETVSDTSEESYEIKRVNGRNERVFNCTLRFENGMVWRVPEDNYRWCEERPMSNFAIYQSTHRGDTMIVVSKKGTGEVAMAYHTDFFEYRK